MRFSELACLLTSATAAVAARRSPQRAGAMTGLCFNHREFINNADLSKRPVLYSKDRLILCQDMLFVIGSSTLYRSDSETLLTIFSFGTLDFFLPGWSGPGRYQV